MACLNVRRLYDSLTYLHVHSRSCRLVTCDPRSLYAAQSSGRVCMRVLMCRSSVFRASARWRIVVAWYMGGGEVLVWMFSDESCVFEKYVCCLG